MAHILNDAGFTQIGNSIIAALAEAPLNGLENRILHVVVRQTSGYHRASASLPLSFICDAVKAKKQNVSFALKELIRKKVLIETACATNRKARELAINGNTSEWDFSRLRKDNNAAESSTALPKETAPESSVSLPKTEVREPQGSSGTLLQSHEDHAPLNINKYKNKKEAAVAVVNNSPDGSRMLRQNTATATGGSDPEKGVTKQESILPLFLLVFGRNPNPIEKEEIEKLLTESPGFNYSEAFSIYTESIRKIGLCSAEKKNVLYLIGIMHSKMKQALAQREKAAAERAKQEAAIQRAKTANSKTTAWVPGAFLKMCEEEMGQKFYPERKRILGEQ